MNLKTLLSGVGLALLLSSSLQAGTPAYAAIVQERDAVLTKIVADLESRQATGIIDGETVRTAKLALLTFRRDTAPAAGERLKQQALIVALQEKRLAELQERAKTGTGDPLEMLRATDAVLAAKQQLEELKAADRRG